jgi:biotin-dependent carboxylase-like uncharacterized protein
VSQLIVLAAGPHSTLQDRGRVGYQRYGVAVAGAFDALTLAAANALVGNSPATAGIEFTLAGDRYEVAADGVRIAVAGDFAVAIDGAPAAPWRSHRLTRGQTLAVGAASRGARSYLAVEGGFAVPPVLGSVATHVRTRMGGLDGGPLKAGDRLPLARDDAEARAERALDPGLLPARGLEIRVVLGPQHDLFTEAGLATFLANAYEVTAEADRMGLRLSGPQIEHLKGYNIVSDGIPLGAIQVPGSGQPIALMVDHQTAGGYPKIAVVIAPDVAALAQVRPGAKLRFRAIDAAEARAAALAFNAAIAGLPRLVGPVPDPTALDSGHLLSLNLIDGVIDGTAPE